MFSAFLLVVAACTPGTLGTTGFAAPAQDATLFERGVEAYRRGDHAAASEAWTDLLAEPRAREDRARLLYDLGNSAWRQGDGPEAMGWYTACLRVEPRHADAWHNLEFVRSELELPPADRGDLRSTALRLLHSFTLGELAWGSVGASLVLGLCLLGEALRGGRAWRVASGLALGGVLLVAVPWVARRAAPATDPYLTVGIPNTQLRAEPSTERSITAHLDPGETVERIDALPGWIRVETADGRRGWAPEDTVFDLEP